MIRSRDLREFTLYVIFGLIQLGIDTTLLIQLCSIYSMDVGVANVVSRLTAAIIGYYLNSRFNFDTEKRNHKKSFLLFLAWWIAATLIGSMLLRVAVGLAADTLVLALSKIVIEAILVLATFLVLQRVVFR